MEKIRKLLKNERVVFAIGVFIFVVIIGGPLTYEYNKSKAIETKQKMEEHKKEVQAFYRTVYGKEEHAYIIKTIRDFDNANFIKKITIVRKSLKLNFLGYTEFDFYINDDKSLNGGAEIRAENIKKGIVEMPMGISEKLSRKLHFDKE